MTAWLETACRLVLWLARAIVPAGSLPVWQQDWQGDFWRWLQEASAHESADGRSALVAHTNGALVAAVQALRDDPEFTRRRAFFTGHPLFPLAILNAVLVAVVAWSGGIAETRHLLRPARLPVADDLVLLSQERPYLGSRRGFTAHETEVFAQHSETLAAVARQQWYTVAVRTGSSVTKHSASNIGPGFFDVLRVAPAFGHLPKGDDEFAVSYRYWVGALGGKESSLGQTYTIDGHALRLVGVLPRDFLFLSPIDIWTARAQDPPTPSDPRFQRFAGLKGVVARLKPGVTAASAEFELFTMLDRRNEGHYTFQVHAAPYAGFLWRNAAIYGGGFLAALGLVILAAIVAYCRDVRSGASRALSARYWGLLLGKVVLSITLSFLVVVEFTGINHQGLMGGVWFGQDLFAIWLFLTGSVVLSLWAWRDQRNRCHVCLNKLRDPIRIGTPGQVLLETTGLELMCPKGHGILYSPESVLGSEMSEHWLGLGVDMEAPVAKDRSGD